MSWLCKVNRHSWEEVTEMFGAGERSITYFRCRRCCIPASPEIFYRQIGHWFGPATPTEGE